MVMGILSATAAMAAARVVPTPPYCESRGVTVNRAGHPIHGGLADSLGGELARIIWDAVKAHYDGAGPITAGPNDEIASDVHAIAVADSDGAWAVAYALTDIMRGGSAGYTDVQATVAAHLYRTWELPFEPAARLVADPSESARARALALAALQDHWKERRLQDLAARSFCWLAVRALALQEANRAAPNARPDEMLDADEMQLLDVLISSAMAGASSQPDGSASIWYLRSLPAASPVTQELRRSLALQGRAK
jgi:hypothetical protein